eukprot:GILI01022258.1.p1 GENE.GILI01022258.1~~GILI01022258.1.p1  ORF type:complete len:353 (-),score=29.79 GILI01022258.1:81-1139(-)
MSQTLSPSESWKASATRFSHGGLSPSQNVGLRFLPAVNYLSIVLLELSFSDRDAVSPDQYHVCRLNHERGNSAAFDFLTVVHRDAELRSQILGEISQHDFFVHINTDGGFALGCLASTSPMRLFYDRMVAGTDPFNVWYLQEAVTPSSPYVKASSTATIQAVASDLDPMLPSINVNTVSMLRPGRLLLFKPRPVCPACVRGTCSKGSVLTSMYCSCQIGFTGPLCNQCSRKELVFDYLTQQCVSQEASSADNNIYNALISAAAGGVLAIVVKIVWHVCRRRAAAAAKVDSDTELSEPLTDEQATVCPPVSAAPRDVVQALLDEANKQQTSELLAVPEADWDFDEDEGSVDYW